jgi:hypothetical protein
VRREPILFVLEMMDDEMFTMIPGVEAKVALCALRSDRPKQSPARTLPRHLWLLLQELNHLTPGGLALPASHSSADARHRLRFDRSIRLSSSTRERVPLGVNLAGRSIPLPHIDSKRLSTAARLPTSGFDIRELGQRGNLGRAIAGCRIYNWHRDADHRVNGAVVRIWIDTLPGVEILGSNRILLC